MTELHDNSSKLTRVIEDLQEICKNIDETQRLMIFDKILTAWYEVKSSQSRQCKSEIIVLDGYYEQNP